MLGEHERVLAAEIARRLLGLGVVAQPHERRGPAAEQGQAVLAQVPEQERQRHPARSHAPASRSRCGRVISSAPAMITAGAVAGLAVTWTVSHWTASAVSISPRALRAAGSRARQVYQAGGGGGGRTGA